VKTYPSESGLYHLHSKQIYHLHHKRPQKSTFKLARVEVVETSEVFFPPRWLAWSDYLSAAALSFLLPSLDGKIQQQLLDVDAKAV
jgi:hypothetical protein